MRYRIKWISKGTTRLEARDEHDAEVKFEEKEDYELAEDMVTREVEEIEEI